MKILILFINILLIPYKLFTGKSIFTFCSLDSIFQKKVRYKSGCRIHHSKMGKYSYLGQNTTLNRATIGKFCSISSNCYIGLPSHPLDYVFTSPLFLEGTNIFHKSLARHKFNSLKNTSIGNDVWIGNNVMIKSGVHIGDGAIIGAGAIVTKNVPPYAIVAGIPAKIINYRFEAGIIEKLLEIKWWDKNIKEIKKESIKYNDINNYLNQ